MTHEGLLAVFAACVAVNFAGPLSVVSVLTSKAYADGVRSAKVRYKQVPYKQVRYKRDGSRRVCGLVVRGGYYSYGRRDVIVSCTWVNRMFTPMYDLQSPAGPFDSGFFFDSGLRPHWWNNAPYPN
jgi:hypothetical protein